jgi:hypothetical protein
MKMQMEEIANLAKKAQESRDDYKAQRDAILAQGLPYDEFLSKTRDLMSQELGSHYYFIQAIAKWSELAFADA